MKRENKNEVYCQWSWQRVNYILGDWLKLDSFANGFFNEFAKHIQ